MASLVMDGNGTNSKIILLISFKILKNLARIIDIFLRADNILYKYYESEYGFLQKKF